MLDIETDEKQPDAKQPSAKSAAKPKQRSKARKVVSSMHRTVKLGSGKQHAKAAARKHAVLKA